MHDNQVDPNPSDADILRGKLMNHGPLGRPYAHQYVLVHQRQKYARDQHRHALLIQKPEDSPLHAGLWNYPGGKIEPGEAPAQAACREFTEETGMNASFPIYVGELTDLKHYVVYLFTVELAAEQHGRTPQHATKYFAFDDIASRERMVPNVPLLMALFSSGVRLFSILEDAVLQGEQWRGVDGLPYSGVHITPAWRVEQLETEKAWRDTIYGKEYKAPSRR